MNPMASKTREERLAIARKSAATRQRNIAARNAEWARLTELRKELASGVTAARAELAKVQTKLQEQGAAHTLSTAAQRLTGKFLLTEDQIVAGAIPWQKPSGVYFLINKKQVVYVGQSTNVYARIVAHTDKEFDSFAFISCDPDQLNRIESLYIHLLRTPLNGKIDDDRYRAPIPLNELISI